MQIEIINRALIKLGEQTVSSTQDLPYGDICELLYNSSKRFLLSSYFWRFAIRRTVLAPLDKESLNPRFKYVFELPADYLLLVKVGEYYKISNTRNYNYSSMTNYEIEGRNIYYNYDELPLSYISSEEDNFSEPFKEVFACRLAAELCVKINNNPNLKQSFQVDMQSALDNAIRMNEVIADTEEFRENTWVAIREEWNNGD